ncbi:MAG: cell division protein FtsA [Pseudomonadota bacterium]|nr:cell division protein FtsA [Pseudomonadota bacterium]
MNKKTITNDNAYTGLMKQKTFLNKGSAVAAIDIGSSKIVCLLGQVQDEFGHIEIVGHGYRASEGIKNGTVIDLAAAENAVREAVHVAENTAADRLKGYPLRDVVVSVSACHCYSSFIEATVDVSAGGVSRKDINRGLVKAQRSVLDTQDAELIHTIPAAFWLDGNGGISDPIGMNGEELNMNIHMVMGNPSGIRNLAQSVKRSHLDISALCVDSYASGLSCLVDDEKDLGSILIDMGAGVTSFSVFQAGRMLLTDYVPMGGAHVTNDIAQGLTTSFAEAERLKTLYGNAMASSSDTHDMIEVMQMGDDNDMHANHVPRSVLVGIIQPRMEEIFEQLRAKLADNGVTEAIGRRVVLVGGASQMPGCRDLANYVLDKQVRLGKPIGIQALPKELNTPAFATVAGLFPYLGSHANEMPAEIMERGDTRSLWQKTKLWLQENW